MKNPDLTSREAEVLRLIARGHTNLEIGQRLCIEEGTVKNHVHSILSKMGMTSRKQIQEHYHGQDQIPDDFTNWPYV